MSSDSSSSFDARSHSRLRPCVINFHGGGFTIGSGTDDSRWAAWCTRTSEGHETGDSYTSKANSTEPTSKASMTKGGLGAIFISISYRLAPEYPYPTPVEDCIDATRYILDHAEEMGIDKHKVVLSGFSAGGSLAVTTALAPSASSPHLSTVSSSSPQASSSSADRKSATTTPNSTETKNENKTTAKDPIAGVIAFYPVLDFFTPRPIKLAKADGPVTPLPGWMTKMFDTSYLPPLTDRKDPMISPGLVNEEKLREFPNCHLVLCGADVLAAEGREFGERLKNGDGDGERGRDVVVRTVPGARHGWDKPPLPLQKSVGEEYDAAIENIRRWCK
jgi:acetyl esterase/lipase